MTQLMNAIFLETAFQEFCARKPNVGEPSREHLKQRPEWCRQIGQGLLYWRNRYNAANA